MIGTDLRGRLAERIAALHLRLRGYRVLARRYATHVGEVDLVVRRGEVVAFVEVKARAEHGEALAALRPGQRRRIERAASWFLASRPELAGAAVRFDLITIGRFGWPRHLPDAWRPGDGGSW